MSAQKVTSSLPALGVHRFSTLDIVGISLSTLLFTFVWVTVFSVFLPERTTMLFSDGLKQASQQSDIQSQLEEIHRNLVITGERLSDSAQGGVAALLAVVQTGGSARGMKDAFGGSTPGGYAPILSQMIPNTAVLGAATTDLLVESSVSEKILKQSYIYINTVSFGLLGRIDKELEIAMISIT